MLNDKNMKVLAYREGAAQVFRIIEKKI